MTTQPLQTYQAARLARDARFDGRFYIAVKTTGIFCRPVCPATSPQERNVEYFEFQQQAMQAGYRPCLRCRPDSAPGSHAWQGVNTTLERGLRLLREHPEQSIQDIAARLGIGERYLHKLVSQAIGVSPKQYRLYSQVLVAKQLLHETQLSVEDVAHASGFASSRRLQAQMKKVTLLSPSQIRKHKRHKQTDEIRLSLSFRPPYNWPMVRDFLAKRAISPFEKIGKNSYQRCFQHQGKQGRIKAVYNPDRSVFDVSLSVPDVSILTKIINNIRRVLDLDADPQHIHAGLNATGLEEQDITAGIRLPGAWSPFEAGCRAIIGQQISVKAAISQLQRVCSALNHDKDVVDFPTPAQWLTLAPEQLKMPQARKNALEHFADYFEQHENIDYHAILSLKGIGPWTVNYMKLRGESDPNLLLDKDLIVAKQLKARTLDASKAAPWSSYLTFQLWQLATESE